MINRSFLQAHRSMAFAVAACVALAGCGGIEVESKLLDTIGLTTKSSKKKEPAIRERSPLVVPPSVAQLPQPGTATTQVATADPSFPQNPEEIEARRKKEDAAKRKAECSEDSGAYGSRQSSSAGVVDVIEEKKTKGECSTPLKELIADAF